MTRRVSWRWFLSGLAIASAFVAPASQAGRPRPPITLVSDDFDTACGIPLPFWSFVDPVGDASREITGVGTEDAQLRIHLPAGVSHDLWTDGDRAPRLVQTVQNRDFSIETKLESEVTQRFQSQGIVIEDSPGNALRFEVYHDGTNRYLFVGAIVGGVGSNKGQVVVPAGAPAYLRVVRTGNQWNVLYGSNPSSLPTLLSVNHTLVARKAGLIATNDGDSAAATPAMTAIFDYLFLTSNPVVPEDGNVLGDPSPKVLTTNVSGNGAINRNPDLPSYVCGASVLVSALPAPGHVFTGWTGDVTGTQNPLSLSMTQDRTLTAGFVLDTTPPVLSAIHVSPGDDSAQITWTTDEPATSEVAYGPTLAYENGTVSDPLLKTAHSITLTNLDPSTLYHFRVTSVNGNAIPTSTSDLTFQTLPVGGGDPSGILSDDFQRNNLDRSLWQFVDPLGDAVVRIQDVGTSGGKASIEVPGGVVHAVTPGAASVPRLRQAANDTDFTVDVGFTSPLNARFQEQGLLIEESATHYLRFDFYHDGSNLRIYAASYTNGSVVTRINGTLSPMSPMYLRVARLGDQWTLFHSPDGSIWTQAVTFTHTIAVTGVSVWAGNEGSPAPAQLAEFDYFFNAAAPIFPEDGAVPADTLVPWIQRVRTTAGQTTAQIRWVTDEASSSRVDYGLTAAYELGSVEDPALVHDHMILLENLEPGTSYQFRVHSTDADANEGIQGSLGFATQSIGASQAPLIDVWYGPIQFFGQNGTPQADVNVLGNVSDPDGVASIRYRLNGGSLRSLAIGPNSTRLAHPGDFNADIPIGQLLEGFNTVEFEASDTLGNVSTELVTLDFTNANVWPLPYTADWGSATRIDDVAQVVDGHWALEGDLIHILEPDYDRLVAIGDVDWTDYEALVPITLWGFELDGFEAPSNRPALGGCLRWIGHQVNGRQPSDGLTPLGNCPIYRINAPSGTTTNTLEMWSNLSTTTPQTVFQIDFGVTYWWKFRVETTGPGPLYSVKVWPQGQPEPASWTVQETLGSGELTHGSMLILAHHVDATFGAVVVTPLP